MGRLREKVPLCLCKSTGVVSILYLISKPNTICDSLPETLAREELGDGDRIESMACTQLIND